MARSIVPAMLALALAACVPGDGSEIVPEEGATTASPAAARTASVASPDTPVSNLDPVQPPPPPTPTSECPLAASRDWSAAVIGKPPGSGDRLRVNGTLTLAERGWRARLEQGAVLEIHPPIQQLQLAFERTGTGGPREIAVRGEFPALSEYGAIDIRCGNRTLATITSVAWTENKIMEDEK